MRMLHLVTVGTSIVRNVARMCSSISSLREYCGVLSSWSTALPDSAEDVDAGKNAVSSSPIYRGVLEFVASDPARASAELNAFISYLHRLDERGVEGRHDVVLYSSDSGVCWFCTQVIEEYLNSISRHSLGKLLGIKKQVVESISSKRIQGLGRDFHRGLLNLVAEIKKDVISRASEYDLIVANLTAGFKPESGMVILVASLIGIDRIYYIHEYMREVVEIPIIPLEIPANVKHMLGNILKGHSISSAERKLLEKMGLLDQRGRISGWAIEWIKVML